EQRQADNALDREIAGVADFGRPAVIIGDADLVFARGAADRHRDVGLVDLADDAVGDGLGHAPPADDLDTESGEGRRLVDRGAPQAKFVIARDFLLEQRLHAERYRRGPGRAVLAR